MKDILIFYHISIMNTWKVSHNMIDNYFQQSCGNIFWTKTNFLRKLSLLEWNPNSINDRMNAERLLGSRGGNFYNLGDWL